MGRGETYCENVSKCLTTIGVSVLSFTEDVEVAFGGVLGVVDEDCFGEVEFFGDRLFLGG